MRKTITLFFWFTLTPILFAALTISAYKLHINRYYNFFNPQLALSYNQQPLTTSDSIFSQVTGISSSVQTDDARPIIIAEFLRTNNSPLEPYDYFGQVLTDIADRYQLDFRLLPSIMMQESNLCKKIPADSYNCLGLGIHAQGTWTFDRYEDNFEAAAKVLRNNYLDKGYLTPDEIQDKYTPSSNGSWEFAVNQFMNDLETAEFIDTP